MEKYFNDIVQAISKIVTFDSSLSPAIGDMPFGKGAKDSLDYFLSLAASFGFETHNYDNYVGEVVFGEGEELGILAHLDVVPAGGGWTHEPFGGEIDTDRIWGRGTMDDKGPAIICLYAMKALKDEGFSPKKKIKLIVGCNEECGWECMKHYAKVAHMPKIGFSPDANFPVIYAEKGIYHFETDFPLPDAPFTKFCGGERVNMVCDRCHATAKDGKELVEVGKSAHASTPEFGENAILKMLLHFVSDPRIEEIVSLLFTDVYGLKEMEDETGKLTLSPNVARFENGVLTIASDIRFPSTHTLEEVKSILDKFGKTRRDLNYQAPLYNDPKSFLISTLQKVYAEATGEKAEPIAIGGGTYARALSCGAGFGPEQDGEEQTIHQANEYITFRKIRFCADIYYRAIKALSE